MAAAMIVGQGQTAQTAETCKTNEIPYIGAMLMAAQVALGVLRAIPVTAGVARIVSQGFTVMTSVVGAAVAGGEERHKAAHVALKVAAAGLALLATVTLFVSLPFVVGPALAAQSGLHLLEAALMIKEERWKEAVLEIGYAVSCALLAAAIFTQSAEVAIAALSVGVALTLGLAAWSFAKKDYVLGLGYLAFTGLQGYALAQTCQTYVAQQKAKETRLGTLGPEAHNQLVEEALKNDPRLRELVGGEAIESIKHDGQYWVISTKTHTIQAEITWQRPDPGFVGPEKIDNIRYL